MERQEAIFRAHVRAANATKLPLVIHVLKAHDAAPRILREEKATMGVLHSYSGGAELAGIYSARLGRDWRVLYEIDDTKHVVIVLDIRHRSAAYRRG